MRLFPFLAALSFSSSTLAAAGRVGLYPLALPQGQEQLDDRVAAQLRDGAAALPGVRAFDLVPHSGCAPDEPECLAAAARSAGLDAMLSASVVASESGYRFTLRQVSAGGKLLAERRGEIRGGPLDLASALEQGVCEVLGGAPCEGSVQVSGSEGRLLVDGVDRGALPLTVRLPVGRHAVKTGDAERRVRVSYARTVHLFAAPRAGGLTLLDEAEAVVPLAATPTVASALADDPRARASRVLLVGGVGLLAAAAGIGLYNGSSGSGARPATYAVAALAAAGAGAVAAGGLLVALGPNGAAVAGRF